MKRDPVEIVAIAIPILVEVVAVVLFIACAFVWIAIKADTHPPTCKAGSVAALFTDCQVQQ